MQNNVCGLRKSDLENLDKILKSVTRNEKCRGRQSSDRRLYTEREDGEKGFKSSQCMRQNKDLSTNKWIALSWRRELHKE